MVHEACNIGKLQLKSESVNSVSMIDRTFLSSSHSKNVSNVFRTFTGQLGFVFEENTSK